MRGIAGPFVAAVTMMVMQPGHSAPVTDSRSLSVATRLFPGISSIDLRRLPGDVRRMLMSRRARIEACNQDSRCMIQGSLWTESERALLAEAAGNALSDKRLLSAVPDDGGKAQVLRELVGLNVVLQVYGLGLPPRNTEIDGPTYRSGTPAFANRVSDAISLGFAGGNDLRQIDPSIGLSVALLDVNDRVDAVAFEPLDEKYNGEAATRAGALAWSKFRYTAIVVPGNGPDLIGEMLSPRGKLRVKLAAARFKDGDAAFILVSGGAVHPRGTKVSEAYEMRRELIEQYGISPDSIILEPYARYTSTNLRNAARRVVALGGPLDRDMLIMTDADHSKYIESAQFHARSLTELGYETGRMGARVSSTELVYRPSIASLRIDPADPLDP